MSEVATSEVAMSKDVAAEVASRSYQDSYLEILRNATGDAAGFAAADEHLRSSYMRYGFKPFRWAMNPIMFSSEQVGLLEQTASMMGSIMEKTMAKYQRDRTFRQLFDLPPEIEELTLVPSGCHAAVPLSRIDLRLYPQTREFRITGIVTGAIDGMAPNALINRGLKETDAYRTFAAAHPDASIHSFDAVRRCALSLMHTYGKWANAEEGRNHPTHPSLAVVDVDNPARAAEANTVMEHIREMGCYARASQFSELRIEKVGGVDQLIDNHGPITCVWLRATPQEALAAGEGIKVLADATRRGLVCTVGGYRSWPCCTRKFLQLLRTSKECREILTFRERAFVDAHVPDTYVITPASDLSLFFDQENWVLKLADGHQPSTLVSGDSMSKFAWRNQLIKSVKRHDAAQAVLPSEKMEVCSFDQDGSLVEDEMSIMLGLYVFEGRLCGIRGTCGQGKTIADWDAVEMGTLIVE